MNNNRFTIRKTGRMTCAWVPTGNTKTPLACVWGDAETSCTASATSSFSNDEAQGMRLCA
jgi:TnpA family transposase